MKNVKNLKINQRKLMAILLGASISLGMTGCDNSFNFDKEKSFSKVVECNSENTYLDELLEEDKLNYNEDLTLADAVDMLEKYVNISKKLENIDFTSIDKLRKLSDEEYEETKNLEMSKIDDMIDELAFKPVDFVGQEERLITYKKLGYLNNYVNEWINNNASCVVETALMEVIKAGSAQAISDDVNVIDSFCIPPRTHTSAIENYCITFDDDNVYNVPQNSSFFGTNVLWDTINELYNYQSLTRPCLDAHLKAIEQAKSCLKCYVELDDNDLKAHKKKK